MITYPLSFLSQPHRHCNLTLCIRGFGEEGGWVTIYGELGLKGLIYTVFAHILRFHSNALLHTNPDVLFLFVSHISIHLCLSSGSFGSVWKCMFLLPLICTDLQPRTIHTAGIFSLTDNIFGWDTQVIKKENGDVFIRHTSCWLATVQASELRSWFPMTSCAKLDSFSFPATPPWFYLPSILFIMPWRKPRFDRAHRGHR